MDAQSKQIYNDVTAIVIEHQLQLQLSSGGSSVESVGLSTPEIYYIFEEVKYELIFQYIVFITFLNLTCFHFSGYPEEEGVDLRNGFDTGCLRRFFVCSMPHL